MLTRCTSLFVVPPQETNAPVRMFETAVPVGFALSAIGCRVEATLWRLTKNYATTAVMVQAAIVTAGQAFDHP
jgi:hypothetical protein